MEHRITSSMGNNCHLLAGLFLKMSCGSVRYSLAPILLLVLFFQCFATSCLSFQEGNSFDAKILNVAQELERERLPLQNGQRLYRLEGLKDSEWYEVKISYPASIPASFFLQLKKDASGIEFGSNRRLLNTEKLIFKANNDRLEAYVLVTVEPAGVVAKPDAQEREEVLFNIVCDALALGIPYRAWSVGIVAVFCLVLAFIVPCFFPLDMLLTGQPSYIDATKVS